MTTSAITNTITVPTQAGITVTATLMRGFFKVDSFDELVGVISTTTNGSGLWTLNLERQSNIAPLGSYWVIQEMIPSQYGGTREWAILVPDSDAVLFECLTVPMLLPAPAPVPGTDALYVHRAGAETITGPKTFDAVIRTKLRPIDLSHPDYCGEPDGTTDNSSGVAAAYAALGNGGGEIFIPYTPQPFRFANVDLIASHGQKVLFRGSPGALIRKAANGYVFKVGANQIKFRDVVIDGVGATLTGQGLYVTNLNNEFSFSGGKIFDTDTYAIEYAINSGSGVVSDAILYAYDAGISGANPTQAAILLPNDTGGINREFMGVESVGTTLFEDLGSENSKFTNCVGRQILITGDPAKLQFAAVRIASAGDEIVFRGVQNSIQGIFAGPVRIEAGSNGTYHGIVAAGAFTADSGTAGNEISAITAASYTDSGNNLFNGRYIKSFTWNPPSVAAGATASTSGSFTSAIVPGMPVDVAFSEALPDGTFMVGSVVSAGSVHVTFVNLTGGAVDLASGTLTLAIGRTA